MSVRTAFDAGVLTLTFARPEKKNAITNAMYATLADGLARAQDEAAVRVVVLDAEGPDFTAGNDLADFAAQNGPDARGVRHVARYIDLLADLDKPLVAAVEGRAIGIGLTMLLHCDVVYAARDARLSAPFVDLGLSPEAASGLLLPARIGHLRAYEMFALGRVVDGTTAAAWGLATEAVAPGTASARARQAAEALARKPAKSLAVTKLMMRDIPALQAQIGEESANFHDLLRGEEAREAFAAFFERRSPDFSKPG